MKEIPLKQWIAEEALHLGITSGAVVSRIYQLGKYPNLPTRHENQRVVWVRSDYHPARAEGPIPGEVRLKEFCATEATRIGNVSPNAILSRIYRGKYPALKFRRVNSNVVYVRV